MTNTSKLLSIMVGGASLLQVAPAMAKPKAEKQTQPNIILIMTDQHTANALSCAGNPYVSTPGIDGLAQDGIRFTRAYASYPLSGPSRASMITGKMPVQLGVKDNSVGDISAEELANSMGNVAKNAGYECLYAGKWHAPLEINLPEEGTGFTKVCDMDDRVLVEKSKPFLEKKYDKPLFYVASFLNPHETCEFAREEALHYGKLDIDKEKDNYPPLPMNASIPAYYPEAITLHRHFVPRSYPTERYTDDDWRKYIYAYYRFVERVDKEIVKLVDVLKSNDLYENSLIIFMSDHGDGVGAHRANQKRVLQEEIANVPFIVKPPKSKFKGEVNETALISTNLDLYQTICDITGAGENHDQRFGKSIRPLIEGKTIKHHDEVYVETFLDGVETRGWAVIGEKHKYVVYRQFKNAEQLFNLENDPLEMQNLAPVKAYDEIKQEMRAKLYDWAVKTDDKMLRRVTSNCDDVN
ncbi:sulfatase [Bacteroides coprosuis DSM 18011]|uniref:Sulfatase n=1 Tax=Bacteroides coprosuis DSM 18011 TaxID=679937 RepID=F3ZSL3_9BACE|nr:MULTISPECIES: sulfatase-like hydrolase/transferase [Bacteroides]EGJ72165.1 sulfatase [Bacteroides coprosuis DSM 18011]